MKLNENLIAEHATNYLYLYKRMFPFLKKYMFRIILTFLIAIPVGAFDGVITLALKPYTDGIFGAKPIHHAFLYILAIPLAALVQGILRYISAYLNDWVGQHITNDIKKSLFDRLLSFEPGFFDENESGFVITRFLGDADTAAAGLLGNIKSVVTDFFTSVALIGVLLYDSWQLAIVAVIVMGASMAVIGFARKTIKHVSQENIKVGSEVLSTYTETFAGNKIVTSYNLQSFQAKRFDNAVTTGYELKMKLVKVIGWLSPSSYFISSFGLSLILLFATHLIAIKQMTGGSLLSFIASLLILYRPIKTMGNTFSDMQGAFYAMARVFSLFDYEPSIKNSINTEKIDTINDSICFENVTFEYNEGVAVLKGISFHTRKGEALALVGNSGGGKTTIANLIPRFYDIKEGSIKIDGIDIRDIELESLRQNISVVFQDNFLFTGTIKENMLLGKFNATEEEINQALENAYLNEFISTLPDGLNTEIGERGVRLSGGQKQRIAIARAMLKNAPVVILDEATSALDNKSEEIVQKALDKLMENKTVIVIAHRLSTIKNAHKIAVVNEGHIVEMGTHDDLMQIDKGSYKALYEMQFKHQKKEEVTV